MAELIRIKECKILTVGKNGSAVGLPKIWVDDNKMKKKDLIEVFRSNIDGKDVLIVAKKKGK